MTILSFSGVYISWCSSIKLYSISALSAVYILYDTEYKNNYRQCYIWYKSRHNSIRYAFNEGQGREKYNLQWVCNADSVHVKFPVVFEFPWLIRFPRSINFVYEIICSALYLIPTFTSIMKFCYCLHLTEPYYNIFHLETLMYGKASS